MNENLSIITPLFQSAKHLDGFFSALFESDLNKKQIELIFVIDACTQEYDFEPYRPELIKLRSYKVFRFNQNQGQYFATIFGLNKASSLILATLDVDCYKINDFFNRFFNSDRFKVVYADMIYKNRSFYRNLGSKLFKLVLQFRTGFKVNNEGSSLRLIQQTYYSGIKDSLSTSGENLDIQLIRSTDSIHFIPFYIDQVDNESSYSFRKLTALFWSFLFNKEKKIPEDFLAEEIFPLLNKESE